MNDLYQYIQWIIPIAGVAAVLFAVYLARDVLSRDPGTQAMQDVAGTILEVLFGAGGGASVLIADEFERRGLRVPPLPPEIIAHIREFTPIAGNILRNPVDYSQAINNLEGVVKTFMILSAWEGTDFIVNFIRTGQFTTSRISEDHLNFLMGRFTVRQGDLPKPVAMVLEPSILPNEAEAILTAIRGSISHGLPVYYSFAAAANAISLVLSNAEKHHRKS